MSDEIPDRTGAMVLRMLYQNGPTETLELAIKSRTHPDAMAEAIASLKADEFIWEHVGLWELTSKGLRAVAIITSMRPAIAPPNPYVSSKPPRRRWWRRWPSRSGSGGPTSQLP